MADAATEITDAAGLSSCSYSALAAVTEMVSVLVTRADAVPFSGSSYCCAAAVATAAVLIPAMAVEMTAAFGLSCFSSAAADAETATATDSAAANKNAHGF